MEKLSSNKENEVAKKAKAFADALGRASMVPVVLATPAAIVMSAESLGLAYAEGNCSVAIEFRPSTPNEARKSLEQSIPCNESFTIGVDAAKDHFIQVNPSRNNSAADLNWPQAAVSVAGMGFLGWLFFLIHKS